jgi:hypothetical protein
MVKFCVFFAVRTEILNIIQMSFCFKALKDFNTYQSCTDRKHSKIHKNRMKHVKNQKKSSVSAAKFDKC